MNTMMIEVKTAVIGTETVQAVDARELHRWLEVGRDYSTWIKGRIEKYGFVEGRDFCSPDLGSNEYAGVQTRIDYFISLDMAKELSMVENNEKGKTARQYFIRIEKEYRKLNSVALTTHELAIRQLKSEFEVGNMFECPKHIIQQEAVKRVRKDTGVDFSGYLNNAPAQQNILPHEVMLEPTELGAQLGVGSGRAMNQLLASWGLQKRENYEWIPTEKGSAYCVKHAWVKSNKEGYNLKWSLNKIKTLMVVDENDSGDWEEVKPEPK